jgi:tRNA-dihydrouridine synthase
MDFQTIADRCRGRLFLSSMMEIADGTFCASRAAGCAMLQLGAFVLSDEHDQRDTYWPPHDLDGLTRHLAAQFETCRSEACTRTGRPEPPVLGANVFPCTDEHVRTTAAAFVAAGGDLYELNAHGGIGDDRRRGTGRMLFLPQHTEKLLRWARLLVAAGGPVMIKGRAGVIPDFSEHVRRLEQLGVHAFHINVRGEAAGSQDLGCLERIRKATRMFLLASGHVTDAARARALFDAGADAVGIAEAARHDAEIFARIAPQLAAARNT